MSTSPLNSDFGYDGLIYLPKEVWEFKIVLWHVPDYGHKTRYAGKTKEMSIKVYRWHISAYFETDKKYFGLNKH